MLRHIPQPLDTGGLVGRVGPAGASIDPARDGLVDDSLLLLLQQRDQLLLGVDISLDAPVSMVEESGDGGLFGEGGNNCFETVKVICIQSEPAFYYARGNGPYS